MSTVTVWNSWTSTTASYASSACYVGSPDHTWSSWTSVPDSSGFSYTWKFWNSTSTDESSSVFASEIWAGWVEAHKTGNVIIGSPVYDFAYSSPGHSKEESEELKKEREKREREREEARKRYDEIERKRKEAEEKAKELLMDLIGEDQREVYGKTGRVLVKGQNHDFIIPKDGFIRRIEKNKVQDFCVHLKDQNKYPLTDNVIALMLAIKDNEEEVIKMANKHGSRSIEAEGLEAAIGM